MGFKPVDIASRTGHESIKLMMKSMLQRTCAAEKMLIKNLNLPRNNLGQEQRRWHII